MYLFRKAIICLFTLVLAAPVFAQNNYPKTLLWRISGKGLQKPSYLFGTMHLNDKRLFRFDDSVYRAIEKTDGLAIEVNPDEMAAYSVTKMFDELEKGKKLYSILEEKDFKKYSSRLSKKFNKPAADITTNDIVKEKNKWVTEYFEKGEMPTFVDAYLYSIARRQGKWLGGIEDITDQAGLMDELVDKTDIDYLLADDKSDKPGNDKGMESMINTYAEQDLDKIELMSNSQSEKQKDLLLIKRNGKMAWRIDSLAAVRTMFFAIGAAHLPGKDGVIDLLKKKGFTVEPVLSKVKIDSKNYVVKETPINWFDVKDGNDLYDALMPGNPAPVNLLGLMDMKFLMDIFSMSGYCTAAIVSPLDFTNPDTVFNVMVSKMFPSKKMVPSVKIDKKGTIGREYREVRDGISIRLQLFVNNKVIYMVMMYAMKKEVLASADAEKFFTSFNIHNNPVATEHSYPFTDSVMGLSFTSPAPVSYNKKLSNEKDPSWKISAFTGTDIANGIYVMLFSKETKPGLHIPDDSAFLNEYSKKLEQQYPNLKKEYKLIQNSNALFLSGRDSSAGTVYMNMVTALRGNRNIILMVISDSLHLNSQRVKDIFSSMKFITAKKNWGTFSSPDNSFSAWAPSSFYQNESKTLSRLNQSQFITYDTTTATSYSVTVDTIGKYYWATSDSAYWKDKTTSWTGDDDSLVDVKRTLNAAANGREILLAKHNSGTYNRVRVILNGNKTYSLHAASEKEFLYNDDVDRFFSEFKFQNPATSEDILQSKTRLLLSNLASGDSATRSEAYYALPNARFSESEIPLLHDALYKEYGLLNEYAKETAFNDAIGRKLKNLKSASTVKTVKENYATLTGKKEPLKLTSLDILAGIHTTESYQALANLLTGSTLKEAPGYSFKNSLKDSLALTAEIFPSLITLAKDSIFSPFIAGIALTLIDSGFIKKETVAAHEADFINAANRILPSLKKKDADFDYEVHDVVRLFGSLNTAACINTLKSFLTVTDKYLKKTTVIELVKKNIPVGAAVLNSISADAEIRAPFYEELKQAKKEALFPKLYLTQKAFAESSLYNASDDDAPSSVTFVAEKTATYKEQKYKFYLFKVSFGKGKEASSYLGVAGGYALTGNALEEKEYVTGIYWAKEYKAATINADFYAYLKQFEKDEEAETEDGE